MNTFKVMADFPRSYDFELLSPAEPAHSTIVRFPAGAISEAHLIRFHSASGNEWVAAFVADNTSGMFEGLVTWPDPNHACVVLGLHAFLIDVNARSGTDLMTGPISDVVQIPQRGMVLFVDFTGITAWTITGRSWRNSSLSFDGIEITNVSDSTICGLANAEPGRPPHIPFAVSLSNGQLVSL